MDFGLNPEQLRWRDIARDFTEKVIKPDVLRRDRLPTAAERIPWDWIRAADKPGLRTLKVAREHGGAGVDILTLCLVGEELASGDLGFAVIMDQCWKMAHLFSEAMTPEQQRRFIPPFVKDPEATLAIAITDAGAGSDDQGYYDAPRRARWGSSQRSTPRKRCSKRASLRECAGEARRSCTTTCRQVPARRNELPALGRHQPVVPAARRPGTYRRRGAGDVWLLEQGGSRNAVQD